MGENLNIQWCLDENYCKRESETVSNGKRVSKKCLVKPSTKSKDKFSLTRVTSSFFYKREVGKHWRRLQFQYEKRGPKPKWCLDEKYGIRESETVLNGKRVSQKCLVKPSTNSAESKDKFSLIRVTSSLFYKRETRTARILFCWKALKTSTISIWETRPKTSTTNLKGKDNWGLPFTRGKGLNEG